MRIDFEESQQLTVLKEHLQNLKERISQARKQGMDTKLVEIKIVNIQPKIQMAQVTGQKKELRIVSALLGDVEQEMKHLRREHRFEDILKRVAEEEKQRLDKEEKQTDYLKLSQNEIVDKTNKLINRARESLGKEQYEKVYPIYREIQGIYKYLPKELKRIVYNDSIIIYHRLRESGIFKKKSKWGVWFKKLMWRFR